MLSEETSNATDPTKHEHLWIVDPIDGTIAFAAGLPFWSVSAVSYFINQKPISSALYLSSPNEILWAQTGMGAFIGKTRLCVRNKPWSKSVIALDQGVRTRDINMTRIAPYLGGFRSLVITPGEAGSIGLVARGNLQALICSGNAPWDYAAGTHLVLEAGGVATDYEGHPYPWFGPRGHVVATPSVLPHIISVTRKVTRYL